MYLNSVNLAGRLTSDILISCVGDNQRVIGKFGVALNRKYKVQEEWKEETTFIDVAAWGKKAEVAAQYLKKGSPVLITGRLQFACWDDRSTGQKRSKVSVVAENIIFVPGGNKASVEQNALFNKPLVVDKQDTLTYTSDFSQQPDPWPKPPELNEPPF